MTLSVNNTTTTTATTTKPQKPAGEIEEIAAFSRFDVVSDYSDHYHVVSNLPKKSSAAAAGGDPFASASSGTRKKIMQEWRLLEKHLPDSIFVRVYENRINLLRAAIVGAAGTPYHDGLFFFDVAFPTDYPARPPMVHYRSFGLRLNPNLYANGRVCLSLLNTWTGKKSEKWNPNESTILQVLISIQALVLNEKPYFNEPGHGMWPGRAIWEKKSMAYNEDVYVMSCKTTTFLLRRPPKNFECFVSHHFRDRGHVILSACRSYVYGHVRVGYYVDNNHDEAKIDESFSFSSSTSSSNDVVVVSDKFKGIMLQLYPELVAAFSRAEASLGNLPRQLNVETVTASFKDNNNNKNKEKKEKSGIAKKVLGKIKGVLGLKKRVHQSKVKN
ncbi:hypothetical protein Q3G72_030877 [Acer saccharum]|nr:hypothetical protein Q3G72_030877 [Acer saccharum]